MTFGRIAFLCFIISSQCFAQVSAPRYSNEFLNLAVGARSQGMGGAQVGDSRGAESGFWNPSFLLDITDVHYLSLMHTELFGGVANFDFLSYASRLDSLSSFGISLIRLGIDDIPDTRFIYDASGQINYDNIEFFSAADNALYLSYARRIEKIKGLNFGANLKIVHRTAGDFAKSWGFGLDAGMNYTSGKWRFSAMGRDITGTFNAWSHSLDLVEEVYASSGNTLPQNSVELTLPRLILGFYRSIHATDVFDLIGVLDLGVSFDGKRNVLLPTSVVSLDPSLGFELAYKEKVYFRSGMNGFQKANEKWRAEPHFGLGFSFEWLAIDYAFSRLDGLSGGLFTHTFSVNLKIDEENR